MEPDKEKDITRLMAETLRQQKLPYKEGSWERFKEFEASKKSKRALWPYFSAVAATALLVVGVMLTVNQPGLPGSGDIAQSKRAVPNVQQEVRQEGVSPDITVEVKGSAKEESTSSRRQYLAYNAPAEKMAPTRAYSEEQTISSEPEAKQYQYAADSSSPAQTTETEGSASSIVAEKPSQSHNAKKAINEMPISRDSYDALARKESTPAFDNGKDSRWSFSVELSPNIKNKEVNLGGGVGVSYALSDRISISSGVSYVALDAQRGPNQQDIPQEFAKTSLSNYNYNKSLSNINTSLVGLDIPLNVRVQVNQQMYASAGVSVFNVLDESRYNQFEEHVAVLAFTGNNNGSDRPEPVMQTLRTQELSEEAPYQGKNFTGFLNLSVGYQLPVLKKLNLAVEPYIKLPIGTLSEQDMDLSNGGLKIITTF